MSYITRSILGIAGIFTALFLVWVIAPSLNAQPVKAQEQVSADVCMLRDGRPTFLMVSATDDYLHFTYINTKGEIVTKTFFRYAGHIEFNNPAGVLVLPGAKCEGSAQ